MRNLPFFVPAFLVAALLLGSCRRDVSAAEGSAASTEPSGAATMVPAPSFDEAAFSLRFVSLGPYAVGKSGSLNVELKAKAPYHVNQEYPHKLKLKPNDSVEFSTQTFARDSMNLETMSILVKVPLKPTRAGAAKVEAEFAFSLCTADRCLIEKRTLATEIRVE